MHHVLLGGAKMNHYPYSNFNDVNLAWILQIVRIAEDLIYKNESRFTDIEKDIDTLELELTKVRKDIQDIKDGKYTAGIIDSVIKFLDKYLIEHVQNIVKYVFFGLTNDGRFAAYIPDTWDFIRFNTIMDDSSRLYGHLVLSW